MTLNPHLNFEGNCREALALYAKALGGKTTFLMTYGESPMASKMPPGWADKVIHASFEAGKERLSAADAPPGYYQKPQGFSVALDFDDPAKAEAVFKALSDGASVQMPLQETFWARRFGMLTDRFGTPWMINCGKPR